MRQRLARLSRGLGEAALLRQSRTHGVEVDIPAQVEPVPLALDDHRLEAPLEEKPTRAVARVGIPGKAPVETLRALGQVGLGRLKKDAQLAGHQGECEDPPAMLFSAVLERLDPLVSVEGVGSDRLPGITSAGEVVDRVLDS